jgi:hypothetical protein
MKKSEGARDDRYWNACDDAVVAIEALK